jgi:hypothetical protein
MIMKTAGFALAVTLLSLGPVTGTAAAAEAPFSFDRAPGAGGRGPSGAAPRLKGV